MLKSAEVQNDIDAVNAEIKDLQQRRLKIDEELSNLKKNLADNLDDQEVGSRITSLKSSRDVIDEVLEQKQEALEQLREKLEEAQSEEKRAQKFQKLIELAKKADRAASEYRELVEGLDHELLDKLISIVEKQKTWSNSSQQFINIAKQLEPAVEIKHNRDHDRMGEMEERANSFVRSIEEEGDVNTDAVLSEIYVRDRHYRISKRNGRNVKPETDNFGYWIYEMMNKTRKELRDQANKAEAEKAGA